MPTNYNQKPIYILFADIKGYSANKENLTLISKIEDLLYEFGEKYFGDTENNCFKVLGDGMLGTSYDVAEIAKNALEIVKTLKERQEQGDFKDFIEKPTIRIALHVGTKEKVRERRLKKNVFKDVAGKAIIETARIEPVVKPNEVFCSQDFANALEDKTIIATPLKRFELGKSHDSFNIGLCVLDDKKREKTDLIQHIEGKLAKPEYPSKLAESFYYFNAIENFNYIVDNSREIKADNYFEKTNTINIDQRKQK